MNTTTTMNTIATDFATDDTSATKVGSPDDASRPSVHHRFDYGVSTVSNLRVGEVARSDRGKVTLKDLELDGRPVRATRRFWRSFFTRFGIAENVFRYFAPEEVFARIAARSADESFRFCIAETTQSDVDRTGETTRRELLAVTSPRKPAIRYDDVLNLLQRHDGDEIRYHNGVVSSTHAPRGGSRTFAVGGDQFRDRFCLETPIDGYGHPRLFLSMLRLVCSNGMIGYTRAFRSDIPMGKDMDLCITRAIQSFDNGDGYAALRQRFESAQTSWASVHECLQFGLLLDKLARERLLKRNDLMVRFRRATGNLSELYGMANIEALSDKRRRVLPSRATVYDVINFASEVATHHCEADGVNRIQAHLGSMISDEYDLEGTAATSREFDDFFVK